MQWRVSKPIPCHTSLYRALQHCGVLRFGLAWLGLAWLGLAWLGLAWLGLAWPGLAWLGLAWLDLAWLGQEGCFGASAPVLDQMKAAIDSHKTTEGVSASAQSIAIMTNVL
jgi:hypothetical protein